MDDIPGSDQSSDQLGPSPDDEFDAIEAYEAAQAQEQSGSPGSDGSETGSMPGEVEEGEGVSDPGQASNRINGDAGTGQTEESSPVESAGQETEPAYTTEEFGPLPEAEPELEAEPEPVYTTEEFQPLPAGEFNTMVEPEPVYTAEEIHPLQESDLDAEVLKEPTSSSEQVQQVDETNTDFDPLLDDSIFIMPSAESSLEYEAEPGIEGGQQSPAPVELPIVENESETGYEATLGYSQVTAPEEPAHRKIALILSGGGARGAFQVGAEKYLRDVKGYHWDIIAGVSVGALNGAMLAMHRYTRLMEIWNNITDGQVYTGGFNLPAIIKLLFGAKSFYSNTPLKNMMRHEFEAGKIIDDLHVGAVSLVSGEYVQFTKEFLELPNAILASSSIPVIWPPVDISAEHTAMVDGGVRNITPVGDVLDLEPDEIVIINCSAEQPSPAPQASANLLSIGMRALDIMQNEIFVNDLKEFMRINALVKEAEQQGAVLHHPRTGSKLKYYPCVVIEPDTDLGGVLDFSQRSVQAALKAGVRRAREVLGRPGDTKL